MLIFFPHITGTSAPLNSSTVPWVPCRGSQRAGSHLSCSTGRNAPTSGAQPQEQPSQSPRQPCNTWWVGCNYPWQNLAKDSWLQHITLSFYYCEDSWLISLLFQGDHHLRKVFMQESVWPQWRSGVFSLHEKPCEKCRHWRLSCMMMTFYCKN